MLESFNISCILEGGKANTEEKNATNAIIHGKENLPHIFSSKVQFLFCCIYSSLSVPLKIYLLLNLSSYNWLYKTVPILCFKFHSSGLH